MPAPTTAAVTAMPATLRQHLTRWAGALPSGAPVLVVANPRNAAPGWDRRPQLLTGLVDPAGRVVVALPAEAASAAARLLAPSRNLDDVSVGLQLLPSLVGKPGHTVDRVAVRWTGRPADLTDAGVWVDTDLPGLPRWLRPFGGQALVAFDDRGDYLAGVGIKRHDRFGHEISVGTEPHARGQGLARGLVAQAARRILDQGSIPTYLHTFENVASSRVAAAAGFDDIGWSALMLSDHPVEVAA
jgi:GNAT superfamily N-acetyltransferase